ncbi:MAG: hypothetical protein M5R41_18785 [Bacteroidia bacterium]|nr:hypothetical protein [Bacteroidia bacterium]
MARNILLAFLTAVFALMVVLSCTTHHFRSNFHDVNSLLDHTDSAFTKPALKAHLKNGELCILQYGWRADTIAHTVYGEGIRYNANRAVEFEGALIIPMDSVAIFETNRKLETSESGRVLALTIMTGVEVIVGIICLTNPKACFGSCPTFYLNADDNFHYADAEGFTNAIAPSLEYTDIDALNTTVHTQSSFSITMKNEALETHCVREVKLLAYPLGPGERVYQSPGQEFYLCDRTRPIRSATGEEGDLTPLLRHCDMRERFSPADSTNLSAKEEIELTFDAPDSEKQEGLLLSFRQTLMTTYLMYSAMGYMGDAVSEVFAKIETGANTMDKLHGGIKKELGNIDVYSWNPRTRAWDFQHAFSETGPIARNLQFVPLRNLSAGSPCRLKLVLNKGLWRIDYAALATIRKKVHPVDLAPVSVENKGRVDGKALADLRDPNTHLISMPGDEFRFHFTLPDPAAEYELFLCSKGYYLEWMRREWLKDKDLLKFAQMIEFPKHYLRGEARNFKRYEAVMEQEFWNSRVDTKTFTYHEN